MAVTYGGGSGQEPIGVTTGESMVYGVPLSQWNTWSEKTRELWMQDYHRTVSEAGYHTMEDKSLAWQLAYGYTGVVDSITGLESVEIGESTNEFIAEVQTYPDKIVDTGKDLALLGGILLAFVLLKDR